MPASPSKKLYIKTYGCQMNMYDSSRMVDILTPLGYKVAPSPEDADMVILNTCHIRAKAAEKVYSELGRLRSYHAEKAKQGERMIIAVAGCVAQAEGEEIIKRAPMVDMVFGPQTYHRLPEMIAKAHRVSGQKLFDIDFPEENKFDHITHRHSQSAVTAFLTIQEGCDKFCTFCVVPYTRGAEMSRPINAIIEEAKGLVANGVREITLLGQNVNAYHGEAPSNVGAPGKTDWGLGRLIYELAEIDGLARIRYTTSHPKDMDDELIAAHGHVSALMPYLHLPVQSGSDKILKAMNRRHTIATYFDIVDRLRKVRPDLSLTSDFIIGFPGETDADFADTLSLISKVGFAGSFSFKYSPRPGTPAALSAETVAEAVKTDRLETVQQLLASQQDAFNRQHIGQTLPVLLEKSGRNAGQLVGRSPWLQPVHIDGDRQAIGQIVSCNVTHIHAHSLFGTMVGEQNHQRSERVYA